jgi:hypothetical protein
LRGDDERSGVIERVGGAVAGEALGDAQAVTAIGTHQGETAIGASLDL